MKLPMIAGAVALAFVAEGAVAVCPGAAANQLTDTALTDLLAGNLAAGSTMCASRGGDSWQEEHHTNGQLWDYKLGDGHAVDPRKQVGSWVVTGAGAATEVTYTYTGGSPVYSFKVYDDGGSYSFCNGTTANIDAVTVLSGINIGCAEAIAP